MSNQEISQIDSGAALRDELFVVDNAGLFGDSFVDVTPLSHEMAETFNDPFGGNATPWWLAPKGNCQNNLEAGDVIEGLPHAVFPITYHPQNEALRQCFAGVNHSDVIPKVHRYPDTTVLTTTNVPQNPSCTPPLN